MGAHSAHTEDLKGKAKEAAGNLTGDKDLKHEGKADQAGASIKGHLAEAKDKLEDGVDKVKDKLHHHKD